MWTQRAAVTRGMARANIRGGRWVAAQRMGTRQCIVHAGTYRETVTRRTGQALVAAAGEVVEVTGAMSSARVATGFTGASGVCGGDRRGGQGGFFRGQAMDLARHPNHRGDQLATDSWAKVVVSECQADRTARVEFPGEQWPANQWAGGVFCGVGGDNGYSANYGLITSSGGSGLRIGQANFYLRNAEFQGPGYGYITRHLLALDTPGEWHGRKANSTSGRRMAWRRAGMRWRRKCGCGALISRAVNE